MWFRAPERTTCSPFNARCHDPGTVEEMAITQTDGRNWEKHFPAGRGEFRE